MRSDANSPDACRRQERSQLLERLRQEAAPRRDRAGAARRLTLVVTRPAAQAGPFIALAEAAGARCIALPTLEIETLPLGRIASCHGRARPLGLGDLHEHECGESRRRHSSPQLRSAQVAAVGGATARALAQARHYGPGGARRPASDSEGLLQLPGVQCRPRPAHADLQGRRWPRPAADGARGAWRGRAWHRTSIGARTAQPDRHRAADSSTARCATGATARRRRVRAPKFSRRCCRSLRPADLATLQTRPLCVPGARVAAAAAQRWLDGPGHAGSHGRRCGHAECRAGCNGGRTGRVLAFRPQHGRPARCPPKSNR